MSSEMRSSKVESWNNSWESSVMVMNDNKCCYFSVRNLEKQQYNERYENLKSNEVFSWKFISVGLKEIFCNQANDERF